MDKENKLKNNSDVQIPLEALVRRFVTAELIEGVARQGVCVADRGDRLIVEGVSGKIYECKKEGACIVPKENLWGKALEFYESKQWDWNYARWLVMVRKALVASGCFENGVYPDPKAWKHYFESGFTPYKAAKHDLGGKVISGFYLDWNGRHGQNA